MTDDEIIEMADSVYGVGGWWSPAAETRVLTFARLIAAKQIERDAVIAEDNHDDCCVTNRYTDGYEIAAAIRGQK
jgi:hypothetical protein